MNKNRRKRIADLRERIDIIKNELEEVMEEEQDARDNLPNNLQDSEKAEKMDADYILTTEKDLVKLPDNLNISNLYVLKIEFTMLEDNTLKDMKG